MKSKLVADPFDLSLFLYSTLHKERIRVKKMKVIFLKELFMLFLLHINSDFDDDLLLDILDTLDCLWIQYFQLFNKKTTSNRPFEKIKFLFFVSTDYLKFLSKRKNVEIIISVDFQVIQHLSFPQIRFRTSGFSSQTEVEVKKNEYSRRISKIQREKDGGKFWLFSNFFKLLFLQI